MATLSEADLKAAEAVIAEYRSSPFTVLFDDERFPAYVEGTIERMVAEGIAAGRAESAEQIAKLEALVEPLPVDPEGHKLTLGMTVFVERKSGMKEGIIIRLCDDDTVRVRFPDGPVWEWHPLAEVHRDKPSEPEPKPPTGLLALLNRYPGWDLERLGLATRRPIDMRMIASNGSIADREDVCQIAACLLCSKDEIRAALAETKSGDE